MKSYFLIFIGFLFFLLTVACVSKADHLINHELIATENPSNPEKTTTPITKTVIPDNSKQNPQKEEHPDTNAPMPEITEELYNKTFDEIDFLIKKLNVHIYHKEYKEWLKYLTDEYIKVKSDAVYLREVSQSPALKSKNITLFDLKDYFFYVIVPSNTNALLEKISFIDNNHVKAYGSIFNKSGVLYSFEKIDEQWKIGILN